MYPYGFDKESGLPKYTEWYEGCLDEFYEGKSGYLYTLEEHESIAPLKGIKYAFHSKENVRVRSVEYIENVYRKLLEYEEKGELIIVQFKDIPDRMREKNHKWLTEVLNLEEVFSSTEEYPMFLKARFPEAWQEVCNNRINKTE